jgi:hypothetical protein
LHWALFVDSFGTESSSQTLCLNPSERTQFFFGIPQIKNTLW